MKFQVCESEIWLDFSNVGGGLGTERGVEVEILRDIE
jgi:hypothetical protein